MFNPDMPQTPPQQEKKPLSTEEAGHPDLVAEAISETTESPVSLADFAKRPENMLPRAGEPLSESGMEALARQWADEMTSIREEESRAAFREAAHDQREMIREELLRNEIMEGGAAPEKGGNEQSFSQDRMVSGKTGISEWLLEKLDRVPGGKKLLGAFALVAGLSAIPKDAEAGFFGDIGKATGDIVTQSVRNLPQEMQRQRQMEEYRRVQAQREAEQAARSAEQLKERYAQDSQRIVDQYDREDANVERAYANQEMQLLNNGSRSKDDALKQKLSEKTEISYHKQKLKIAESAWNGMSRVKEKYIQIGTTGVSYQSQVNDAFLKNLQRVAAKEMSDLSKLGVEVVSIIPVSEVPTARQSETGVAGQEKAPGNGGSTGGSEVVNPLYRF